MLILVNKKFNSKWIRLSNNFVVQITRFSGLQASYLVNASEDCIRDQRRQYSANFWMGAMQNVFFLQNLLTGTCTGIVFTVLQKLVFYYFTVVYLHSVANGKNNLLLSCFCRYKTSMCRDLTAHGSCPRGHNCTFAHSQAELDFHRNGSRNRSKLRVSSS
jgi:hypothetical protein